MGAGTAYQPADSAYGGATSRRSGTRAYEAGSCAEWNLDETCLIVTPHATGILSRAPYSGFGAGTRAVSRSVQPPSGPTLLYAAPAAHHPASASLPPGPRVPPCHRWRAALHRGHKRSGDIHHRWVAGEEMGGPDGGEAGYGDVAETSITGAWTPPLAHALVPTHTHAKRPITCGRTAAASGLRA